MYLFEVEPEVADMVGKPGHVLFGTARMTADEVRDDLLAQSFPLTCAVENGLELMELFEGRLTHELQHMGFGVLRCNF